MAKTALRVKQARTPKFGVRGYTRCQKCGRPRAVFRKFGLCRICMREMAHKGELPGITKSFLVMRASLSSLADASGQPVGLRRLRPTARPIHVRRRSTEERTKPHQPASRGASRSQIIYGTEQVR